MYASLVLNDLNNYQYEIVFRYRKLLSVLFNQQFLFRSIIIQRIHFIFWWNWHNLLILCYDKFPFDQAHRAACLCCWINYMVSASRRDHMRRHLSDIIFPIHGILLSTKIVLIADLWWLKWSIFCHFVITQVIFFVEVENSYWFQVDKLMALSQMFRSTNRQIYVRIAIFCMWLTMVLNPTRIIPLSYAFCTCNCRHQRFLMISDS